MGTAGRARGPAVLPGSHNPYLFNGVKYKPETGSSAPSSVIAELERLINASSEAAAPDRARSADLITVYDPRPAYYTQIGRMVDLAAIKAAGLRIVHECMYGSG